MSNLDVIIVSFFFTDEHILQFKNSTVKERKSSFSSTYLETSSSPDHWYILVSILRQLSFIFYTNIVSKSLNAVHYYIIYPLLYPFVSTIGKNFPAPLNHCIVIRVRGTGSKRKTRGRSFSFSFFCARPRGSVPLIWCNLGAQ